MNIIIIIIDATVIFTISKWGMELIYSRNTKFRHTYAIQSILSTREKHISDVYMWLIRKSHKSYAFPSYNTNSNFSPCRFYSACLIYINGIAENASFCFGLFSLVSDTKRRKVVCLCTWYTRRFAVYHRSWRIIARNLLYTLIDFLQVVSLQFFVLFPHCINYSKFPVFLILQITTTNDKSEYNYRMRRTIDETRWN